MSAAQTYDIADLDGRNTRTVTLAEFLAEHEALKAAAQPISDAFQRGDIMACAAAQAAYRRKYGAGA